MVRGRGASHYLLSFLEADREARDYDHLQDFSFKFLIHGVALEVFSEAEESGTFPFHCVVLCDCVVEEVSEELKRNCKSIESELRCVSYSC